MEFSKIFKLVLSFFYYIPIGAAHFGDTLVLYDIINNNKLY